MRTSKWPIFLAVSATSAALVLSVACGGKDEAKSPAGAASGAPSSDPPASGSSGDVAASSGGTTTTQLDASDLQGAKLTSTSRTEVETKGDAGPRPGPGGRSDEPGRKVEDIRTIVLTHRDEARACYDKALKDHPGIEGDLDIKWTIDPQGAVTDAAVDQSKSSIHEDSVGTCIIDVIKKIKFAPSGKGYETRAHYPFNFHPKTFTPKDAGK